VRAVEVNQPNHNRCCNEKNQDSHVPNLPANREKGGGSIELFERVVPSHIGKAPPTHSIACDPRGRRVATALFRIFKQAPKPCNLVREPVVLGL
jgi:hypothetical protein